MASVTSAGTELPPGTEPILLVHGYSDTSDNPWWDGLTSYLVNGGYESEDVSVLNLGELPGKTTDSPEEYAAVVGDRLADISSEYDSTVDIIAHSMGGLDSRWCIEKRNGAQYVDDLTTLGTSHQGTYNAYLGSLTEGGRDMQPGSEFLTELNDGTLATGVEYTALWSSADELITPSEYAQLPSPEVDSVSVARSIDSGFQEHGQLIYDRSVFDQYSESLR